MPVYLSMRWLAPPHCALCVSGYLNRNPLTLNGGKPMSRYSTFMLTCALGTLALVPTAWAANGPIIRDCSFASTQGGSVDADFVLLSGATLKADSNGKLTILTSQNVLDLTASESVDTGDNARKVTLMGTISSPGTATQSFTSNGTRSTIIGLPIRSSSRRDGLTVSRC